MVGELDDMEINRKYGLLGIIECFVSETEDPHFLNQLEYLQTKWLSERQKWVNEGTTASARERAQTAIERVSNFLKLLEKEGRGEI